MKHIVGCAGTILTCVVGLLGAGGCSHTPDIYTMSPDHIEEVRSNIATVGVTLSSYPAKKKIAMPAKGVVGGATRGMAAGATMPVVLGFISPLPGGTALGVLIAPFTAAAGMVYGAGRGVPAEDVEEAEAVIDQAADRLAEMNIRRTFTDEVIKLGRKRTGLKFVAHPEVGPREPGELVHYDQLNLEGIDAVLELRIETAGLRGPNRIDPSSDVFVELRTRLIRARDNEVLLSETLYCASEQPRTYIEWAENEGQFFIDEFSCCVQELSEKVVDDFFLIYPLYSR